MVSSRAIGHAVVMGVDEVLLFSIVPQLPASELGQLVVEIL